MNSEFLTTSETKSEHAARVAQAAIVSGAKHTAFGAKVVGVSVRGFCRGLFTKPSSK